MDDKSQKIQFDTIRDSIDEILKLNPENLSSDELLKLTHQLDRMLIDYIQLKSG